MARTLGHLCKVLARSAAMMVFFIATPSFADALAWELVRNERGCNLERDLTQTTWFAILGASPSTPPNEVGIAFNAATLPKQTNESRFDVIIQFPRNNNVPTFVRKQALLLDDGGKLITFIEVDRTAMMVSLATNQTIRIFRYSDNVELAAIPVGPNGMKSYVDWRQCNVNHPKQRQRP